MPPAPIRPLDLGTRPDPQPCSKPRAARNSPLQTRYLLIHGVGIISESLAIYL